MLSPPVQTAPAQGAGLQISGSLVPDWYSIIWLQWAQSTLVLQKLTANRLHISGADERSTCADGSWMSWLSRAAFRAAASCTGCQALSPAQSENSEAQHACSCVKQLLAATCERLDTWQAVYMPEQLGANASAKNLEPSQQLR